MRIQETQKVLKEARVMRHAAAQHEEPQGLVRRVWSSVSSFPGKVADRIRHH